jgi:LuxR family maltose regulon positive regulatory protein
MQAGGDSQGAVLAPLRLALLDALRGYFTHWLGDKCGAIAPLRRALDHLDPVACSFTYIHVLNALAMAYEGCGQREKAQDLLSKALAEATTHHRPERVVLLEARVNIHLNAGELAEAADAAEHLLSLARALSAHAPAAGAIHVRHGWAHYLLGTVRYEQNELESAAEHWRHVEGMRYQVAPGTYLDSLFGLALIAQAQGEAVQALAYAQAVREVAIEQRSPTLLRLAEALAVRLALAGGQHAEASRQARQIDTTTNRGNAIWLEQPCLVIARALLTEGTPDSLAAARQLAEACHRQAKNIHNVRQVIPAVAVQALVWRAHRRTTEALDTLDRALALAEPRGFVRTFLDLGAPMAELLQRYESQHRSSPYLKRLLAAFARELHPASHHELAAQYVRLHGITPLTRRELELLDLLAQRLTYREIAEHLVISPNTVKKHVSNVYGKLGVSKRREAIAKAREVGLLSPA